MTTKTRPQIHMDDTILEDAELEKMLEERQELKPAVADFKKADKNVKERIRKIETPTPYRVGRFVISSQPIPAKSVAFEAEAATRITIKLAGEE